MDKIRQCTFLLICSIAGFSALGQSSENEKKSAEESNKVLDVPIQSNAVHQQNVVLNKAQIELQPANEAAWIELIQNTQYSFYNNNSNQLNATQLGTLNNIALDVNANLPNTFAASYSNFVANGFAEEGLTNLVIAKQLAPDNPDWLDDYIGLAEIKGETAEKARLVNLLKNAEKYDAATVKYAENTLAFAPENAILITHGHEDEYPLEMALVGNNSGVQTLHVRYLSNEGYRNKWLQQFGLKSKNFSSNLECVQHMLDRGKIEKPVYLTLTMPPDFLKKNKKNLYMRGTLLGWKTEDSAAITAALYQEKFDASFADQAKPINRNYLLLYASLQQYYSAQGDIVSAGKMAEKIIYLKTIPQR